MTNRKWTVALLAATALTNVAVSPALAQSKKRSSQPDLRATVERQQAQIDALTAQINQMRANAVPVAGVLAEGVVGNAEAIDENASKIEFMQATIEAQQAQLDGLKKTVTTNTPAWKGAPEFKGSGFTFKARGRMQYDAGYVSNPNNRVATKDLGFNSRFRRLRLGVEGAFPGDFLYKAEIDFASAGPVGYGDVFLEYAPAGKAYSIIIGNQNTFQNLEQITSSRFISLLERSQMTEGFNNSNRRLGISANYKTGDFRIGAGVFNQIINANSTPTELNGDDYDLGARATYSPQAMGGTLHLGANINYREFKSDQQGSRYRTRPFIQTTGTRFVDTGNIAGTSDVVFGLELAGIWPQIHAVGEMQWTKFDGLRPGYRPINGDVPLGTLLASNPSFFSVYGEVGYFFTGETRGYRDGAWNRTKVLNPFDKGGWGALELNGRIDYLDLESTVGGPNVGVQVVDGVLNGGRSIGYAASLIWIPTDYVRFILQYTRDEIRGGPLAGVVVPISTQPIYDRTYGVNIVGLRTQFDF